MRLACICPSIFDYPHVGTPWVAGIVESLERWFAALTIHQCQVVFSPDYIEHLMHSWLPVVDQHSTCVQFRDCWGHMLKASEQYSALASGSNQKNPICGCVFSKPFWTQQLNDLMKEDPIVVTENCIGSTSGIQTVRVESDLKYVRPERWMKFFCEDEWSRLPLHGEMPYEPPKGWERTGIHKKVIGCGKGYPDQNGKVWSYDKTEDHWDVYSRNSKWYDRVTPQGKRLEPHLCQ